MALSVQNLSFSYPKKSVLCDISFTANYGENLYILGANGVGKSTLFRCLLGHLLGNSGAILLFGKDLNSYSPKDIAKHIAYIPQNYDSTFHYSVLETVTMGRASQIGFFSSPSKDDYDHSYRILKKLGIEALAQQSTQEISGGERQLVYLARALAQDAKILILDEPTSNLDYGNGLRIQTQLKELAHEGFLIIQSSHNPQSALFFADRVLALHEGSILKDGTAKEVITQETLKLLYHYPVNVQQGIIVPQFISKEGGAHEKNTTY